MPPGGREKGENFRATLCPNGHGHNRAYEHPIEDTVATAARLERRRSKVNAPFFPARIIKTRDAGKLIAMYQAS